MRKVFKTLLVIVLFFGIIQLIPINMDNPPVDPKIDFVQTAPKSITQIIKNSCYDCHSFETKYPESTKIAPISWIIRAHVNNGRKHLNFSEWLTYNNYQRTTLVNKIIETVEMQQMPPQNYINKHPEASLSTEQKELVSTYFQSLKN